MGSWERHKTMPGKTSEDVGLQNHTLDVRTVRDTIERRYFTDILSFEQLMD